MLDVLTADVPRDDDGASAPASPFLTVDRRQEEFALNGPLQEQCEEHMAQHGMLQ